MEEIFPGVHHWSTYYGVIDAPVSSYFVEPAGLLLDPMMPEGGVTAIPGDLAPQQIVLTIGLHDRDVPELAAALGATVRVPEEGAHRIGDAFAFAPYRDGEEIGPGVFARKVGVLAPDDYALEIRHGGGALALADAIHRYGGAFGFFPDDLLGDDPDAVRAGVRERLRTFLELDFEHLLLAHGDPIVGRGKAALREFLRDA
jgi:hypothetical protein